MNKNKNILTQADVAEICSWIKTEGKVYAKFRHVFARKVASKEKIATITTTGLETVNTAQPGDFVVKNQTNENEQYVLKPNKFLQKYEYCSPCGDGWDEYRATGLIYAIHMTDEVIKEKTWPQQFFIEAAWGEQMFCSVGDYLACPTDLSEFYRIGSPEFDQTYQVKK